MSVMLTKFAFTICDTQIPGKFTSRIIILARREKHQKYQKIPKNYETSGHSLDTIKAAGNSFHNGKNWAIIVSKL